MPISVIIYCFHLPPRLGQCQWLSSGGSGWGRTCAGSLVRSWMAQWPWSQQSWWHLLSARLAGGTGSVVPTHNSHSVLLKPGCSSFVPGVQLYAVHAPLAAVCPFPCSVLGTACLSLRQTRKGFYPQPARRVMQIPEAPAPICRAAVSQLSPLLFSVGRKARHCFKLLPVE